MDELARSYDFSRMELLHFAPEVCTTQRLRASFARYITADLYRPGVDLKADLQELPLPDGSFDIVYASHVLEHVSDDVAAISEIRRILRSGGFAVLPVPLYAEKTIEYEEADEEDAGHVRAPGLDYFERYAPHFASVKLYSSSQFPAIYQTYNYRTLAIAPTPRRPLRPLVPVGRHADVVPVCFV
jgi:SAM-dependent methyltransferase